ncbi:hypothetical protein FRC06_008683, partial [Ceratobasidium sp. 370]
QEAADDVEVQYPQITQAGTFELSPQVIPHAGLAVDKQPEQAKRGLAESVDIASKRACLSFDPNANPSLANPPSPNPHPIVQPNFATRPTQAQMVQGACPSAQAQPAGPPIPSASHAPLRIQNAPSPSVGRLTAIPMATTVLDSPTGLPAHPRMATPVLRVATPAPLRVVAAAPSRAAPARVPAAARPPAPAAAPTRAPGPATAPSQTRPPGPTTAAARAPGPVAGPSRASAVRACAPVIHARTATVPPHAAPPHTPPVAARNAAAASSRPPAARAPPSADVLTGVRLPSVPEGEPDWGLDLGGPAPGVPARVRPYVPYTDLLDDRAEEIAEAEARQAGKRPVGRKPERTAKDYHGDTCRMIPHTVKSQFALAVVEGAYDNRGIMMDLSQTAYEEMWPALFPAKELHYPDEYYFPMITNWGTTERGEVRKRICPIAHNTIANFIHPARMRDDMQHNKREVERLLPQLFHYKGSNVIQDPPSLPYESIEIQRALGAGLFHSLSAVSVVHRQLFGPRMPLPVMAFILTNIQVCIMEFADGCFQAIELNVTQQYEMYMNHLRGLQAYE